MKVNLGNSSAEAVFEQVDPKKLVADKKAFKQYVRLFWDLDSAEDIYYKKLNYYNWQKRSESDIVKELTDALEKVFLAKIEGNIVGFVNLRGTRVKGMCSVQLVVGSEHRNKKIGKSLLQFVFANTDDDLCLNVTDSNDAGKHLYESVGFKVISQFMWRKGTKK